MENLENIFSNFLKKIDEKLENVLYLVDRVIKENIKLRSQLINIKNCKIETPELATLHECTSACAQDNQKKKLIMESMSNGEMRFYGYGTFDAKETIKTFGEARFDKGLKSWILTPQVTIQYIEQELRKEFDFQIL